MLVYAGLQLIDRANSWADMLQCAPVVHFLMANATVSLESMLASYPGPLSLVTVQVRKGSRSADLLNARSPLKRA